MRTARCRDGTGSPPRPRQEGPEPRREGGTVTGEPSALKGACWVRREAARKRPAPIRVRDLAAQPTLLSGSLPVALLGTARCSARARRPSVLQAGHMPSWRGSSERYALPTVAAEAIGCCCCCQRLVVFSSPWSPRRRDSVLSYP